MNTKEPPLALQAQTPLRDPFLLTVGDKTYIYSTGWLVTQLQNGELTAPQRCVEAPADCAGDIWAPEVYHIGDRFYMLTTYRSKATGHRGCALFCSDSPEGPFRQESDGFFTPHDRDSIDATLYFDQDNAPWAVFVHEWTCTDDGIGRIDCARFSDDLTRLISEPIELFRADAPGWSQRCVTDGCFLHRMQNGKLLMIWSNWDPDGYCIGIAESQSGSIEGPWIQQEERLYSKAHTGEYDGGHGMIFKDRLGQLWLILHSPNKAVAERVESPTLIPIKETDKTLVWDEARDLQALHF